MAETTTTAPSVGQGVIVALIGAVVVQGLATGTTYTLLGIVLADAVPGFWNGVNAAATGLGFLLGVLVVPPLCRRIGAGRTALTGVVLLAAALLVLAVVRDFWAIFSFRLLLGCAANLVFVVAEVGLNSFASPAQRGRVMGAYTAAGALGYTIGPAIVALQSDQPAVLLLGCAAVATLAALPLRAARGPLDRNVRPTAVSRVLPAMMALPSAFGFLFVAAAVDGVAISLLPIIALDQGHPIASGALFVTSFHIGLLAGQPLVGLALDCIGRRPTTLVCCVLSLGCTTALIFGAQVSFWPVTLLMCVWGGTNYGLYTAGLALIGDRFSGETLTAATTAFAAVYAIAAVLSPVLAGQALDSIGAAGFYVVLTGVYLMTLLCGAAFFRPSEPTSGRK